MVVFKGKREPMLDRISQKLDAEHVDGYDIVDEIPSDCISISGKLDKTEIYLPEGLDYSQYDIDDYIRSLSPGLRTQVSPERDLYVMKIKGRLTEAQFIKLIKFIIKKEEVCSIVE